MAEYIPVAPPSEPEPPEVPPDQPAAPPDDAASSPQSRKVLDQSRIPSDMFEEDILSDIERRLDSEPGGKPTASPSEKVELDKADLPILDALIPPPGAAESPPEVEVELSGEEEESSELEPEAGEPKSRKKLFVFGGVGVLALSLGVALWFALLAPSKKTEAPEKPSGLVEDKIPDPKLALRLELEPFLVPLTPTDKGRLLLVGVSLEVSDPAEKELLVPVKLRLRDAIYRALRDRPAEEVMGARSKNLLQSQIKTELNHLLGSVIIYQVYFTNFVVTG